MGSSQESGHIMLARSAIVALIVLAADAAGQEFAAVQLCNKAAVAAAFKGMKAQGGASEACMGCMQIMFQMGQKDGHGHGGHRRLLGGHELPAGPLKCFGFDEADAKSKASCISNADSETSAMACLGSFSDAATKAIPSTCSFNNFQEVAKVMGAD